MNQTSIQAPEQEVTTRKTLTIPAEVHAKLKALADSDIRGIGDEIEWLIQSEVARREQVQNDAA